MIRAYSAHFVMHREMITFVMLGPMIPTKAMAMTMFGKPSTKSIKRDNQRSTRGVENPANPPITIPMAPLMPMMVKAIPKEALPPYRIRDHTSRPSWSVPNRWVLLISCKRSATLVVSGSKGAIYGAQRKNTIHKADNTNIAYKV